MYRSGTSRRAVLALALAAFATASCVGTAAAADSFDSVLAGARKEGKIVLWLSSPALDGTHEALIAAFNKRFGLDTKMEWVSMHPLKGEARVIAEATAGQVNADVVGAGLLPQVANLSKRDILKPYPWVEVFGKELPGIGAQVDRALPEYRGRALGLYDNAYGLAWNTQLIKEADLPTKMSAVADPKWRGKFAVSSGQLTPYDMLAAEIGEAKVLELAKQIVANNPVYAAGTPAIARTVTVGEAPVGFTSYTVAMRAKKQGQPQEFKLMDDYVPTSPLFLYVPEKSPHPNTARLFAAWLVTEGYPIAEPLEQLMRVNDPSSPVGKRLQEHVKRTGAKLVTEKSLADVQVIEATRQELTKLITSAGK